MMSDMLLRTNTWKSSINFEKAASATMQFLADRGSGIYIASDAVRQINHKGKYFEVPGPAFCEPSPQRTPLLFQAGVSEAGNGFGGKHAEVIFVGG